MGKKFVGTRSYDNAGASLTSEARKWRRRLWRRLRTNLERPPPTFSSITVGGDIISAAPGVSLQKARSWDEGVASNFSSTPLRDIFQDKKVVIFGLPGAYTGVCSKAHVPSYKNNIYKFKAKGIDSVICVSINDPYTLNGWAERLEAKDVIEFYGDFDGSFH